MFVKGVWNPTRVGTLMLNTNSCSACFTSSKPSESKRMNGASRVSKWEKAWAPAASPWSV